MTEAAAIRYLVNKGWYMLEDDWFALRGVDQPVCLDTAYQLQRNMERVSA